MKQQQQSQNNAPSILKKKSYSKPVLTILGKVSDLTAGGSGLGSEAHIANGEKICDQGIKKRC